MKVIEVGTPIYLEGATMLRSETFRVPEGRQLIAVIETITLSVSGTSPKIAVTLEQSSDLRTWSTLYLSGMTHEINAAPQSLRTAGTSSTADRVIQPYIRLTYNGTAGSSDQKIAFSARIALTEV